MTFGSLRAPSETPGAPADTWAAGGTVPTNQALMSGARLIQARSDRRPWASLRHRQAASALGRAGPRQPVHGRSPRRRPALPRLARADRAVRRERTRRVLAPSSPMIWLYWRRLRLAIAVAGITLAMLTALVLLADRLAGPESASTSQSAAAGGPAAARPRFALPSADNALVRRGLLLMTAAVAACRSVSYPGIQVVAWSSSSGSSTYLIDVWHQAGLPQRAATDGDADDHAVSAPMPGSASHNTGAVGVLSISPTMLSLLRSNYVVEDVGTGSSTSRPARIGVVTRHDGTLAAQFWLDRDTGLPLRREMFDESGRRVSAGGFFGLGIGSRDIRSMPPAPGQGRGPSL